jgi:hypothetical protein
MRKKKKKKKKNFVSTYLNIMQYRTLKTRRKGLNKNFDSMVNLSENIELFDQ